MTRPLTLSNTWVRAGLKRLARLGEDNRRLAVLLLLPLLTSACVTISAPDKPIVINLNINIKQEVVYRLDGDAKALIEQNKDIF
ncbi:YnbE family lipoprotein [Blastomonas sp.]|uniref:YnbE family lipoprotein n=1 Tax=Blastomonas sp. TaxID=1909299 RepID=UPI0035933AD7